MRYPLFRPIHRWSLGALLAATGCANMHGQPQIENAYILPDQLEPGDTAIVTVEVTDKFNVIDRIEGVVKEDRTITFNFQDAGVPPDETASDDIWTIQVDVPFNAPPGEFEFLVTAYDAEGNVIAVDDEQGEATALQTSFNLKITYPESEEEAPSEP